MTKRQQDYQEFLESLFWKNLRNQCLERDGHRCRFCNAPGRLQAHHVIYPDDWYETTLDDLITLCVLCHEKEHGFDKEATKHAKRIERLTKRQKNKKIREKKRLRHKFGKRVMKQWAELRAERRISREEFLRRKAYSNGNAKREGNFEVCDGRMIYNPR